MIAFPSFQHLVMNIDKRNIAYVKINRPEVHNSFNEKLIEELTECAELIEQSNIRVVILTGEGRSFCAGADLNYMRKSMDFNSEENENDAATMSKMFELWNTLSKPIIGRINGAAIGGGTGLVAACDIAVASENAKFGFSEVKLGLIPAVIGQFVITKIGVSAAREYFLSGEKFNAKIAEKINLVNYVVPEDKLDQKVEELIKELLSSGPSAIKASKELIRNFSQLNSDGMKKYAVEIIAKLRQSSEGQEGMEAFFSKRPTKWRKESE